MALDPIVSRRFDELTAKADNVAKQREHAFTSDTGKRYFTIPSAPFREWATNVLNLIQRTFGEDSVHYRHFNEQYTGFDGFESGFLNCRAVFAAAREDYEGGYLFNVRALAKAEVLSDALSQAKEPPKCRLQGPSMYPGARGA